MSMRFEIVKAGDQFSLSVVDKRNGKDVIVELTTPEVQQLRDFLTMVLWDTGIEWTYPEE